MHNKKLIYNNNNNSIHISYFLFFFSLIFPNKYFASTIIDPSAVQISSIIILFIGYFVILNIAYYLNEFLRYFYRKYSA